MNNSTLRMMQLTVLIATIYSFMFILVAPSYELQSPEVTSQIVEETSEPVEIEETIEIDLSNATEYGYPIADVFIPHKQVSETELETVPETEVIVEPIQSYFVEVIDGKITEPSLQSICRYVGQMYDISPEIIQAIAYVESRYYVGVTSACDARGLCQVVERWNKDKMQRLGVTDLYDPYSSILMCADILSDIQHNYKYGDDIVYVLMAYNQGVMGAKGPYESGHISKYATMVLDMAEQLKGGNIA